MQIASVNREVFPLDLASTASTAVAIAIGDALTTVWMGRQRISLADFALNNPAGSLGKKLTMTVADLMEPRDQLPTLHKETTLPDVIRHLTTGPIGSGWASDPDQPERLLGLITDGDLHRTLRDHNSEEWVSLRACNLMTANPITTTPEVLTVDAGKALEHNRRKAITVLPVVNKDRQLQGLFRLHELVQTRLT